MRIKNDPGARNAGQRWSCRIGLGVMASVLLIAGSPLMAGATAAEDAEPDGVLPVGVSSEGLPSDSVPSRVASVSPSVGGNPFAPAGGLPAQAAFRRQAEPPLEGPVQVSEALPSSYFVGDYGESVRRRAGSVANYIQGYNRRLAQEEVGNISQAIVQFSDQYNVDYRLLTSLIAIESSFRRDAVSSSGAIGMGQLKPDTARWLGVMNPYDPVDNIAGTARYLSWLVRRYNGRLEYALSAYFQGQGHVDRNGITPVCMPYLEKVNRALGPLM